MYTHIGFVVNNIKELEYISMISDEMGYNYFDGFLRYDSIFNAIRSDDNVWDASLYPIYLFYSTIYKTAIKIKVPVVIGLREKIYTIDEFIKWRIDDGVDMCPKIFNYNQIKHINYISIHGDSIPSYKPKSIIKESINDKYNEFCVLINNISDFYELMKIIEIHNFNYEKLTYDETERTLKNRLNQENKYVVFVDISTTQITFIRYNYFINSIENWYEKYDFKETYPKILSLDDKEDLFIINKMLRKSTWSIGPKYNPKSIIKENIDNKYLITKWNSFNLL